MNPAVIAAAYNSISTPGVGTITSDPGNAAASCASRPFHRRHVAMHQNDLLRRELASRRPRSIRASMRAELELLDLAAQTAARASSGSSETRSSGLGSFENAGGRFRIGITDEKNRVLRVFEDAARENIRERFRRHHSARERVDSPGPRGRVVDRLAVENERLDLLEQLQAWKQPAGRQRPAIVNLGHLHAQTADVDRKFTQQFLLAGICRSWRALPAFCPAQRPA